VLSSHTIHVGTGKGGKPKVSAAPRSAGERQAAKVLTALALGAGSVLLACLLGRGAVAVLDAIDGKSVADGLLGAALLGLCVPVVSWTNRLAAWLRK
jgi:hypothetical protein